MRKAMTDAEFDVWVQERYVERGEQGLFAGPMEDAPYGTCWYCGIMCGMTKKHCILCGARQRVISKEIVTNVLQHKPNVRSYFYRSTGYREELTGT